jgi:hypothetical protein
VDEITVRARAPSARLEDTAAFAAAARELAANEAFLSRVMTLDLQERRGAAAA